MPISENYISSTGIEEASPHAQGPLTDLSFITSGAQWPPPSQEDRMKRYEYNYKLWSGAHDEVFASWWTKLTDDDASALKVTFNWHKRLSTIWADMMVSEPPKFVDGTQFHEEDPEDVKGDAPKNTKANENPATPAPTPPFDPNDPAKPVLDQQKDAETKKTERNPRQEALDRITGKDENTYRNTLHEVYIDVSRYGNGLTKIIVGDEGAEIWAQPPTYWFPVTQANNLRKIKNHVLAWTFEVVIEGTLETFLWVEIHHKGSIEYKSYRLNGHMIGESVPVTRWEEGHPEHEDTGVKDFLVVPFAGLQASDDLFGLDDYRDLDDIIAAIEVTSSRILAALHKHTDPNMYGPPDQITVNESTGLPEFKTGGRYIQVDSEQGEEPPGYMVWDASMEAQFQKLDFLLNQLYITAEVSPAAFGQQQEGLAESGSALRRLMMAPLTKVARLVMRSEPSVKKTIRLAAEAERAAGFKNEEGEETPPLNNIQVQWADGLPQDPLEQAQVEEIRTGHKATSSVESSIRRLDGGTEEDAQAELEKINEEATHQAQQALMETDATMAVAAKHAPDEAPNSSAKPGGVKPGSKKPKE